MDTSKRSSSTSSSEKPLRFFGTVLLFAVLLVCFILYVMPQYTGSYYSSLLGKARRLRETTGPKIVLLGYSDMSYGVRSQELEEAFGMPVVNMGYSVQTGNVFNEELCRLNVQPGDIYIMTHATYADGETILEPHLDPIVAWCAVEDHFELWPLLYDKADDKASRPIDAMAHAFPTYIHRCLQRYADHTGNIDEHDFDALSAFNEYGDVEYPRPAPIFDLDETFHVLEDPVVGDKTVERLNELNAWLRERGATLLLTWFPIAQGLEKVDTAYYAAVQEELRQKLTAPLITDYSRAIFDYPYFYNNYAHLNDKGVALRTERLIEDLAAWMEQEDAGKRGA